MPWIFRYFWFIAAAFMLANVLLVRRRLDPLVERGDFLARVGPALGRQPSYERRYSPKLVRGAATALILVSALGAMISWRIMPPSPDLTCPGIVSDSRAP